MMEIQSESWKRQQMIIPPNRLIFIPSHAANHSHGISTQIWSRSQSGKSTQSITETPPFSFHSYNPLNALKSKSSPSSTQSKSFIQTQLHTHQHFISTTQYSICFQIRPQSLKLKQHLFHHHLYPSLIILIHNLPPIPTARPNHTPFHQSSPFSPHSHQQINNNHISPPLNPLQRIHPPHT